jgi:hypothetical protein
MVVVEEEERVEAATPARRVLKVQLFGVVW